MKSFFTFHKKTLYYLLAVFVFSATVALAVPPSSPYAPGSTLDPQCAPGSTSCSVVPLAIGAIIANADPSSVLFAGPDGALTSDGTVSIIHGGTGAATAADARVNLGLRYATTEDVTNNTNIAAWGDSLTKGTGLEVPYPTELSTLTGFTVYNGGIGGETSIEIKARFDAAPEKHDWPTVIWSGRNNRDFPEQIKADIAAMVAALGHDRYLVLGVLNSDDLDEYVGGGRYSTIVQLNEDLAETYGDRFIDIRSYIVSQYDPGVAQDVIDHGHDVPPSSLRTDHVHLTTQGYRLVAQQVSNKIDLLKMAAGVLTTANVQGMFEGRTNIDLPSGGSYSIGGKRIVFMPSQESFPGTLYLSNGGQGLLHTTASEGWWNTYAGLWSGYGNTTGSSNTGIGFNSLYLNTTGSSNTAAGYRSMYYNTTGISNTAYGSGSLYSNSSGTNNVATGGQALYFNTTGANNVGVGQSALRYNSTGSSNIAIGRDAGFGIADSSNISNNTIVGFRAGYTLQTGANGNIILGYYSGDNITTGANNIIIGYDIDAPSTTGSNQLNIGNIIFGTGVSGRGTTIAGLIGIGTAAPTHTLTLASTSTGFAFYNTSDQTTNYERVLQSWNGDIFSIRTEKGGTGINSRIGLGVGGTDQLLLSGSGFNIGNSASLSATNTVLVPVTYRTHAASGVTSLFGVVPTVNQSGTAGYRGLLISPYEQATGSGVKYLLDAGTNSAANGAGTHTSRMVLTSAGFLGIANTAPSLLLHVGSSSIVTGTTVARFENAGGTCDVVPSASGGVTCSSDMTLKKNIDLLADGSPWSFNANVATENHSVLSKILALVPVNYNWNVEDDTEGKHAGFIAQDVRSIFPDLVTEDKDSHLLSLNYTGLIPYTVQAIKEMNVIMQALPVFEDQTLATKVADFLRGIAIDGTARVDRVEANKICLQGVCLDKNDFEQLLQNKQQASGTVENSSVQEHLGSQIDEVTEDTEEETIEEEPEVILENIEISPEETPVVIVDQTTE